MRRLLPALRAAVCIALLSTCAAVSADEPGIATPKGPVQVLRVTPNGETASSQRQVVVQFDRPMVVLGSVPPRLEKVPVEVSPALLCNWHWVNTATLACELGERNGGSARLGFQVEQGGFAPATTYKVVVHKGIKALDGSALDEDVADSFFTERPKVQYSNVSEWSGPVEPVVRVYFNLPVAQKSIEAHLYFSSSAGRTLVSAMPDPDDSRDYYVIPAGGGAPIAVSSRAKKSSTNSDTDEEGDEEGSEEAPAPVTAVAPGTVPEGEQARFVWLIAPRAGTRLPAGEGVTLDAEEGFVTPLGPDRGEKAGSLQRLRTYGDFVFEGVSCGDDSRAAYLEQPGRDPSENHPACDPEDSAALVFSAPLKRAELAGHVMTQVDGKSVDLIGTGEEDQFRYRYFSGTAQDYRVALPSPLKAAAAYRVQVTAGIKDIWGRALAQGGSAGFDTRHREPRLNFENDIAVLEKGVDSEVPLFPTNVDALSADFTRLYVPKDAPAVKPVVEQDKLDYKLPPVRDLAYFLPLDVRGMLRGQSGVVQGRLESVPDLSEEYRQYKFFAEVTPFHVQAKIGHYNSLVWVTDMATGRPVPGARVEIYPGYRNALDEPVGTPAVVTGASGLAVLPGAVVLDPDGTLRAPHYGDDASRELLVRVSRGEDLALLPLEYNFEVNTYAASHYQVFENLRKRYGHVHAWGTTAQGIYRAGDTIQYKLIVRDQDNAHFVPPPDVEYTVWLEDPMGNTVDKHEHVKLSEFGGYSGEYKIPESAPVGWYAFKLSSGSFEGRDYEKTLEPMRVLVSDFTPAPFHVDASLNGTRFQPGDKVEVTTSARLHSGGPYTDAEGRVTASLLAEEFTSSDPAAAGFSFSAYDTEINQQAQTVNETTGRVDGQGVLTAAFELQDAGVYYGKLLVEGDVRDERGKYIAAATRAAYLGRDRFVGLRLDRWVLQAGQPATVQYLVVDGDGKPAADSKVKVEVERLEVKASRVKGPGNAYLTQYARDWVPVGGCEGMSGKAPADCTFTPDAAGSYRIKASVQDTRGREHASSLRTWAIGKGEVLWEDQDDGALTVVPEKSECHVGDTARYLIQNPYPGAQALVSIERYGVLRSWVQTLEGSTPVISFKVEQDDVPGFYLSITAVSPRVAKPLAPGEVDLGKPTFRSAYLQVPVVDDYKALDVKVSTPKDSYKPRDQVTVNVNVKARHGEAGKAELAVAVLDDAVFDLISSGKDYFDPYKGFYTLDGLDVKNYSLLMRLVGRQSFEKKGATPGGDGGAALSLRSLFKFVSYWNPVLQTDARGNAKFSFAVPDNLTGWRVLVVAVNHGDRMGLGQGTFKVNRSTELRPILPNQLVQGDRFTAGFSVMNRTDAARDIKVHVEAKGSVQGTPMLDQTVHVDPYKRAQLWLPVVTGAPGTVDFTATAGDKADADGLRQSVPVKPVTTRISLAQYGTTTGPVSEPVQYPAEALAGSVRLGVNLAPSVIGNLDGAFGYVRDYPYLCWEQRLTKAVMAANYKRLHAYLGKEVEWAGSEGIPDQALADAAGFQAPNGGMAYWVADDRYVDPYLSAYTALAFNWLRAQGYGVPATVEARLHGYLQGFLKGDSVPDYYSQGMRSSVRAVALAALAADRKVTLDDLRRYEPYLKDMDLFGKSWFMQASLDLGARDLAAEDLRLILNHANETGGKFEFSETLDDGFSRILSTPMRSNCTVLSALSRYAASGEGAAIGDVPFKLVRSITQVRGGRAYWENTQENLFCMQALADYAQAYETTAPDMQVAVSLGKEAFGSAQFRALSDAPKLLNGSFSPSPSGVSVPVGITPTGQGRLYYSVDLSYAPRQVPDAINDGLEIHREYSVQRGGKWILLKSPMNIARGELVRVDLYVSVPAAREFVVVDDPVPGGLEPVDRNLATSSTRDADAGAFQAAGGAFWFNFDDWHDYGVQFWDFYHQELRHDSARFYADYLPGGHYHLSYSAQAVAAGTFMVQAPKAEEMYDPDVFGLGLSSVLVVSDAEPGSAAATDR